ncbi:MAG: DegT/DnrJ/EryC1/StrS family aminotransferase [Spirochaetota bacterium]
MPYGRQLLGRRETRAVRRVLRGSHLTQGPCVERFEEALRELTGAPYAVAVTNGTVALDLAVRAVKLHYGLSNGAPALTSANTFVASSNALLYNRLKPLFCDISPNTYNLNLREVERLLEEGLQGERPVELLLPVHFAGVPVDMAELWKLARKYAPLGDGERETRLPIIEDAAHAIGSRYDDSYKVGSCVYSDACCFSFHPVKTITTAEGGAITCRDQKLYELLLLLRNHGISREPESWVSVAENCPNLSHPSQAFQKPDASDNASGLGEEEPFPSHETFPSYGAPRGAMYEQPPWYYEMQVLGYNARLSDVHAVLGVEQLRRLDHFGARRRHLAAYYTEALQGLNWLSLPFIDRLSCPHLYVVRIDFAFLRLSRSAVMWELQAQGIGTQVHYIPLPLHPYYRGLGYGMDALEHTLRYYREALSLPLYPGLKRRDQDRVIRAIYRLEEP